MHLQWIASPSCCCNLSLGTALPSCLPACRDCGLGCVLMVLWALGMRQYHMGILREVRGCKYSAFQSGTSKQAGHLHITPLTPPSDPRPRSSGSAWPIDRRGGQPGQDRR